MVLGLSSGLLRNGHEVVVYGSGDRDGNASEDVLRRAAEVGIETHHSPSVAMADRLRLPIGTHPVVGRLRANDERLDLVVIHGMFRPFSHALATASASGGITSIACPHDPYSPELFRRRTVLKRAYWSLLEKRYLARVAAVQVLAPSHVRYLRSLDVSTPAFVVPNGVEVAPSAEGIDLIPNDESRGSGTDTHFRLLYLGRWDVFNKGLDVLLRAMRQDRDLASSELSIAGRAAPRERRRLLRLISALGLSDRVRLEGFVDDRDAAIASADALVLPSRFDGFGQVVVEALALGTPVIVSSRAGASEFLGADQGVVVVDPDVDSMADGIRRATASADALAAAARAARASLVHEFSWDVVAGRWLDEVERLGIRNGRRSA